MHNRLMCRLSPDEREAYKNKIKKAQVLLKKIGECIDEDIAALEVINDDDYTNPAFPILRAYKDGIKKGLTKLKEYVIIDSV